MVAVLPEGRALQFFEFASSHPELSCLADHYAGAVRVVDASFHLASSVDQPCIGVLLPLEGLEVALPGLIQVIGDPGGFGLVAGFPGALAYRRHCSSQMGWAASTP